MVVKMEREGRRKGERGEERRKRRGGGAGRRRRREICGVKSVIINGKPVK